MSTSNTTSTPTLDQIYQKLTHWRHHKKNYKGSGIPDSLWKLFFDYEKAGNSAAEIRRMFSLNTAQYKKKYQELCEPDTPSPTQVSEPPTVFCEAHVESPDKAVEPVPPMTDKSNDMKKNLRHLKSTQVPPEHYLDHSTIIIECIDSDGRRLKIHTTTQSLDVVMKTFYQHRQVAQS